MDIFNSIIISRVVKARLAQLAKVLENATTKSTRASPAHAPCSGFLPISSPNPSFPLSLPPSASLSLHRSVNYSAAPAVNKRPTASTPPLSSLNTSANGTFPPPSLLSTSTISVLSHNQHNLLSAQMSSREGGFELSPGLKPCPTGVGRERIERLLPSTAATFPSVLSQGLRAKGKERGRKIYRE